MKTAIPYTSTLSATLMRWLEEYASQRKTTKRSVIEEALERYRRDTKRKRMEASFKRAAKDPEMRELAEWGMEDFNDMLKRLEV